MSTPEDYLKITQDVMQAANFAARTSSYRARSHGLYEASLTAPVPSEISRHLPSILPQELGGYVLRVAYLGDSMSPPAREVGMLSHIISIIRQDADGRDAVNYCIGQQNAEWSSLILRRLVTHVDQPPSTPETLKSEDPPMGTRRALTREEVMLGISPLLADLGIPPEYVDIGIEASPLLGPAHEVGIAEAAAMQNLLDADMGWVH